MLKTIKSKIILLTLGIIFILSIVLSLLEYIDFKGDKELTIGIADFTITNFVEQINRQINSLEDNAVDLALMGELYYKTGKDPQIADYLTKQTFKYYNHSLGGGIWFEPYVIDREKRLSCTYAFQNSKGVIVIDRDFESEEYDYLSQSWYTEIVPQLKKELKVAWSRPYFENQGSVSLMTTVGAGIYDGDNFIGLSTVDWQINAIMDTVLKMKPTENSFALFGDSLNDFVIVSTDKHDKGTSVVGSSLHEIPWFAYSETNSKTKEIEYLGVSYLSFFKNLKNNMFLVVNVPTKELFYEATRHFILMLTLLTLTSIIISVLIYIVLKKNINKPIEKLTGLAKEIGMGNLEAKVIIAKPLEFAELSNTFNQMTTDIKNYIFNLNKVTQEKDKIESELSVAKKIQYSVLPNNFNLNRKEIDIYAVMNTAKEVGGDFYDFFFIDETHFMFLIADVSGKGVPAALFMMTSKAIIQSIAKEGIQDIEKVFCKINDKICESNREGYFITLFVGILNTESGVLTCINCGHNPPLLKKDHYEYFNVPTNLVLGVQQEMTFETMDIQLAKGDTILLYTDGVTEALNEKNELYGEERLITSLNSETKGDVTGLVEDLKADLTDYIGSQIQSDDITILALKYNGA